MLGVAAVGAEIGLIGALYEGLRLPLWLASALAAEALILLRFAIADRWVFGHRRPTLGRLGRYQSASLGALVVSWLVLNGSAARLGVSYVLATLLGTGAAFAWSLLTNFLWVWKPKPA